MEPTSNPSIHSLRSGSLRAPPGHRHPQPCRLYAWGPSGLAVLPLTQAHRAPCGGFPVARPQGKLTPGTKVGSLSVGASPWVGHDHGGRGVHGVWTRSLDPAGRPQQAGPRSWGGARWGRRGASPWEAAASKFDSSSG